jgi:hypothetical protein
VGNLDTNIDLSKLSPSVRQELLLSVWHKVISIDPSFEPYFNRDENPLDKGIPSTVRLCPVDGETICYQRAIIRSYGGSLADTATELARRTDPKGNEYRIAATRLPDSLPVLDPEGHPLPGPYYRLAESILGPRPKQGETSHVEQSLAMKLAVNRLLLPVQLYHELIHVRFRLEQDPDWPSDQRPATDFYNKWADPNFKEFQEKKQKLIKEHGVDKVHHWLEEKFAIDQAFAQFGNFAFNEEIADVYIKRQGLGTKDAVCELYDLLDRYHKVPTSGRPSGVTVEQFIDMLNFDGTEEHAIVHVALSEPRQTNAVLHELYRITHRPPDWPPEVQRPFPKNFPPAAAPHPSAIPGSTIPGAAPAKVPTQPVPKAIPPHTSLPPGSGTDSGFGSRGAQPSTGASIWNLWRPPSPPIPQQPAIGSAGNASASATLPGLISRPTNTSTWSAPASTTGISDARPAIGDSASWTSNPQGPQDADSPGIFRPLPPTPAGEPPGTDAGSLLHSGGGFEDFIDRGGFGFGNGPDDASTADPIYRPPDPPAPPAVDNSRPPEDPPMAPFIPSTTVPYMDSYTADWHPSGTPIGTMENPDG